MEKKCKRCSETKPIDNFRKYSLVCKDCVHKQDAEYRKVNKEKILTKNKEYYERNKEEILKKEKAYREQHADEIRLKDREKTKELAEKREIQFINCLDCGVSIEKTVYNKSFCESCSKKRNKQSAKRTYIKNSERETKRRKLEYQQNKEEIKDARKRYYYENKDDIAKKAHEEYLKNKPKYDLYHKEYRNKNKETITYKKKLYEQKTKNNVNKKIRKRISNSVYQAIKRNKSVKKGSILSKLPYTIQELRDHLEKQFEPWMNWDNWKQYNPKTWDDNDQSTWTWNIDHIEYQKDLLYDSMDHPNFLKCWDLSNLRPYNAKKNIIENKGRIICDV
jgi:hypothetical protein